MLPIHRNIKVLAWFNFFCDFRLYAPIAIIYFSDITGSYALGMSIFSATMLAQALFEVPTGILSDYIGRKHTMIIGALAGVFAISCYAIGGSYAWLLLGAILEGLGRSFYSGNNDALLMDTLKQENQSELFAHYNGKVSASFQIALAISSVLGGIIAATFSSSAAFWVSVIPQALCFILALYIREPSVIAPQQSNLFAHLKSAVSLFIHQPKLRQLSIINSVGYAVGESGYLFRSAFFILFWPTWALGIVAMLANAGASVSFYLSGRLIKKFKELPIIIFAGIYNRFITLIALLFPSWFSPLLMSSSSLLYGVEETAEQTLLQREYSDAKRATMGSINSLLGSVLFAIMAVLLGLGADKLGPINALLILQIPMVVVVFLTWRLFITGKRIKTL